MAFAFSFAGFNGWGSGLEPIAAVGHPPRYEKEWECRGDGPPEGQDEVRQQAQQREHHPEDLFLHEEIVSERQRLANDSRCDLKRANVQRPEPHLISVSPVRTMRGTFCTVSKGATVASLNRM